MNFESELDSRPLVLFIQSVATTTAGVRGKIWVQRTNYSPSPYTCGTTEGKHSALHFKDIFHLFSPADVCCVFFIKFTEFNKETLAHCVFDQTLLVWQLKDEVFE